MVRVLMLGFWELRGVLGDGDGFVFVGGNIGDVNKLILGV